MNTTKLELVTTLLELYPNITINTLQTHMNRISENHHFITSEIRRILGYLEVINEEVETSRNDENQIVYRVKD